MTAFTQTLAPQRAAALLLPTEMEAPLAKRHQPRELMVDQRTWLDHACGMRIVTENQDDPVLFWEDKGVALTEPVWEGGVGLVPGGPSSGTDEIRYLA